MPTSWFVPSLPYVAAFKLDPDIGRRDFVTEERRQAGPLLLVVGFPGEPVGELQAALERLDLRIQSANVEEVDGPARFIVSPSELTLAADIAEIAAVKSIEEVGDVTLNNGTTSWVIQSNVDELAPVWAQPVARRGPDHRPHRRCARPQPLLLRGRRQQHARPGPSQGGRRAQRRQRDAAPAHGTFSAGNAAGRIVNNDALSAAPNANNGNAPRARCPTAT